MARKISQLLSILELLSNIHSLALLECSSSSRLSMFVVQSELCLLAPHSNEESNKDVTMLHSFIASTHQIASANQPSAAAASETDFLIKSQVIFH